MKLSAVIALLGEFGLQPTYIQQRLRAAKSGSEAFNIFQGLKIEAEVHWLELMDSDPEEAVRLTKKMERVRGLQLTAFKRNGKAVR